MSAEQLKADIATATASAWPAFAAEHPALARTIGQTVLSDFVTHSLADDPAFIEAYRAAVEARVGEEALTSLVSEFVAPALRRLL